MPARQLTLLLIGMGLAATACGTPAATPGPPGASPAVQQPIADTPASAEPTGGAFDNEDAPEAEAALLRGARLDLQGRCTPLRTALPEGAVGAISCTATGDTAGQVAMILFDTQARMLAAYRLAVAAESIALRTHDGRCSPTGASEGGYVPGDDHPGVTVNERLACWLDPDGVAHSLVTGPPFLLFRVDGRPGASLSAVGMYAMLGAKDQPGGPTLWAEEPLSPEK